MSKIIEYAINHARLTVAVLLFVLTAGFLAYATIPKEAEPDVTRILRAYAGSENIALNDAMILPC